MSITGCIVTYNNAPHIERVVRSIYTHVKRDDFTLYISDNASVDGTLDIVRAQFPQAVILENGCNKGFAHGQNAVLPLLDSELHFIINPDVILQSDAVSAFEDYFKENPDVVMAVPKFLYEDGREQFTPKKAPTFKYLLSGPLEQRGKIFKRWRAEYTFQDQEITAPVEAGFCSGCFICVRTEIYKKIGGFDERYFLYVEDADLTREAKKHGRTVYHPHISVIHLWERASRKQRKYFFLHSASVMKYFWKWKFKR